ncbi:MAG: T9SS type A sorting domain-containing protein [Bacteroidota bacterium]
MKRTLLLFSFCLTVAGLSAQVTLSQVDDFEDGTKQGWFENGTPGETVENIATDGPAGTDDNYLRDFTTGVGAGGGSRMVIRNNTQWIGDFTSEGVGSITLDVRALTAGVTVRVSMTGPGGKFSSTTGVAIAAGSEWTQVVIPISASDMVSVSDGFDGGAAGTDINATLGGVTELRILSNPNPAWRGEVTSAEMHIDNITATGSLSTPEFKKQNAEFTISPNPAKNKLNIVLPSNEDMKLEVFDVLGKRVYHGTISQLSSSIDVSNWRSGVYLVKVSNDQATQTKRFIKQ